MSWEDELYSEVMSDDQEARPLKSLMDHDEHPTNEEEEAHMKQTPSYEAEEMTMGASEEPVPIDEKIEKVKREWEEEKQRRTIFPYSVREQEHNESYDFVPPIFETNAKKKVPIGRVLIGLGISYLVVLGLVVLVKHVV